MKNLIILLLLVVSTSVFSQNKDSKPGFYLGGGVSKSSNMFVIKKTGYNNNYIFANLSYYATKYQIGTNISRRNFALYVSFRLN